MMLRFWLRWMLILWCLWILLFAGALLLMRKYIVHDIMRVQIVGANFHIDFDTGIIHDTNALPPPLADSMSPDGQYIVTVVGSPRGSSFRVMNLATRTSEMIGPYRAPTGARTPAFWSGNDHLWLVTLSRDSTQTLLRGLNPAHSEAISVHQVYDFPAYYVRLSPNRQWLVLGSEAFTIAGISHSVYQIAVANIETGELAIIGASDTVRVRWSRNGEWVVTQYRDELIPTLPQAIHWHHIPTGRTFTTHAAAFDREVAWSGDGHFAAYRVQAPDDSYEVYQLNLDTLENTRILTSAISVNLYWVANELLLEVFTEPKRTLYRMINDDLLMLSSLPETSFLPLMIAPDEQYLIYHMRENGEHAVYRLHIDSGRHERLSTFEAMPLSISWEDD